MSKLLGSRDRIEISEIGAQADRARQVLARVRSRMLSPNDVKVPPRFTPSQLGALVELESTQIAYRARSGQLPSGQMNAAGTRREFSLADVRAWSRSLRAPRMRPEDAEAITIAVANFKGGVTKTTTAMTLAQGLSLRGHKVLVIDLDPQGSLTTLFGILPDAEVDEQETMLPLFGGDQDSVEYAIRQTYWDGIDLIPSTSKLFGAEFMLPARQRDQNFQFWNVLHYGIEMARQNYDAIIIDTAPALSYVTINAMMAADGIITPLVPNALDFASSVSFWDLFYDLAKDLMSRTRAKQFDFVDVLLSKVDSADVSTGAVREWISAAYGQNVLPIEIPKTATAGAASAEFGSIYDLRPGSAGARTIKRAIDAYEIFVQIVETQMVEAWRRQVKSDGEAV